MDIQIIYLFDDYAKLLATAKEDHSYAMSHAGLCG